MSRVDTTMTELSADSHDYDSNGSKSPLHSFGIFNKGQSLSEKKLKADGQPPKRRGPKPDTKPALTRRQELNRQAQRTHRERKEVYIKALEQEVLRLKETYGTVCRDRDAFADENRRLRDLLASHGINCPADLASPLSNSRSPALASSSGSFSGSYAPPSTMSDPSPPPGYLSQGSPGSFQSRAVGGHANGNVNGASHQRAPQYTFNVDQVGINFVLALERPCMDHLQMLCVKSQESDEDIAGHVLMATCPPANHLLHTPHIQYPHQVPPEIPSSDLLKLLDLSARLPLEGEITPVMAWAIIMRDDRLRLLNEKDIAGINDELKDKVRCYGFGAVLEEFEVKDALEGTLASKMEQLNVAV